MADKVSKILEKDLIETMTNKAFAMLEEGINNSGLGVPTKLNTVKGKVTPHAVWVEELVNIIIDRLKAVKGAYAMLAIGDRGNETLITLEKDVQTQSQYGAKLGISFDNPENTRNLAIMLHGGELMGDEIAKKTDDGEKVVVNARIGYDGDVANEIGRELSKWFEKYFKNNDEEIEALNKRIKEATEEQ